MHLPLVKTRSAQPGALEGALVVSYSPIGRPSVTRGRIRKCDALFLFNTKERFFLAQRKLDVP